MQPRALFGIVLLVGALAPSPAPAPFLTTQPYQGEQEVAAKTDAMRACLYQWADAAAEGATDWQQAAARMLAFCERRDQAVIVAIQKSELGDDRFAASLDGYRAGIIDHAQALAAARVPERAAGQPGRASNQ